MGRYVGRLAVVYPKRVKRCKTSQILDSRSWCCLLLTSIKRNCIYIYVEYATYSFPFSWNATSHSCETRFNMAVNHSTAQVPRLIAARVDFYGEHEPERSYASVPRSSARLEDGFREITYHMLASAVNKAAWWLDSVLTDAQSSASPPVFAYSGPNDIRYPVLVLASIKTGRKVRLNIAIESKMYIQNPLNSPAFADSLAIPISFHPRLSQSLRSYRM